LAKFHFIVPVLSQVMAGKHWARADNPDGRSVEDSLNRCMQSLVNQTAIADVRIHVVCHEIPIMHVDPTRIAAHSVTFPRPPDMDLATYNKLSGKVLPKLPNDDRKKIGDKYSKIKVGLTAAFCDPEAQWIMIVDHDDLIHKDVAAHALEHDGQFLGGHTVTRGYAWQVGAPTLRTLDGFHKTCGSCNIVRLAQWEKDLFNQTKDINAFGFGNEGEPTSRKNHWLFAGHASTFARLRKAGRDTRKLPFRAAVYVTDTGANYSNTKRSGSGDADLGILETDFGIVQAPTTLTSASAQSER